ncbi:MAG: GNAT family N-acetyltransferase [Syntrophaceae bacterium]
MNIVELTENQCDQWEAFCDKSGDAWFWHTVKWLKYCAAYKESTCETRDLSFMVTDDSGILAICPLLIEKRESLDGSPHLEIAAAGSGGMIIVPAMRDDLSDDRREKICKEIFEHIRLLARKNHVVRATFRITPLASQKADFNWLLRYGFIDSSVHTQMIDLSPPLEHLWRALRKGHKYDVHRGERYYQIHVYDQDNPDKNAFEQYRLLHHKAAGRVTRPLKTFEMMYDWIKSGNGMLCGVEKEGRFAGFSYIILYKDGAYYGSASDDPDFETNVPISHVIQWRVIQWLKEKGYRQYEIGQQQFGAQIHDIPSPKELSISFFKRGFGGKTVPAYKGVQYYDQDYMEADFKNNLNKLLSQYQL